MKLSEAFRIAWEAILKNKVRSFLTMLGIIIGVGAVIIMVGISAGTEATISDQITSLGSNLVFVQASFSRGGPNQRPDTGGLTFDDATAIQTSVTGVVSVVVEQASSENVAYGDTTLQSVELLGATEGFPSVRSMTIADGRYFTQAEIDNKQKVVVLGSSLATSLFGTSEPVGQYVTVGTTKMVVIGVFAHKGLVGTTDFDARIYTPITVVFQKFTPSQFARFMGNRVRLIYVKADTKAKLTDVTTQINLLLLRRHKISATGTADFTITTQQDIISTQESTTAAFRSLLAWVAGVSLIVGGIGIMNIMLVSVTERTREIGIRQAVGATPADIRLQFLTEALMLSIVGGLIGTAVGIGGAYIFGALSNMRTVIQPASVFLAFGSAAIVGAFFGYYPANQAAQLDPIEALRYE
jgi:putative ABC transport system permease protein